MYLSVEPESLVSKGNQEGGTGYVDEAIDLNRRGTTYCCHSEQGNDVPISSTVAFTCKVTRRQV